MVFLFEIYLRLIEIEKISTKSQLFDQKWSLLKNRFCEPQFPIDEANGQTYPKNRNNGLNFLNLLITFNIGMDLGMSS